MEVVYKALNKDMTCTMGRGIFQYRENEWITEDEANVGCNGLHACLNVLHCLSYYSNMDDSVYYMGLADGDISEDGVNTRISCTRLKLLKRLDIDGIVTHALNFIATHPFLNDESRYVSYERGIVDKHFIIARGKNPAAKGKLGQIIAFVKEEPLTKKVAAISMYHVDGESILPDVFYRFDGKEAGVAV